MKPRLPRDLPHAPSGEPVEWALAQDVLCCGDILVQFLHIPAMASKHKKMCSLWFHTSMVDGDGAWRSEERLVAVCRVCRVVWRGLRSAAWSSRSMSDLEAACVILASPQHAKQSRSARL